MQWPALRNWLDWLNYEETEFCLSSRGDSEFLPDLCLRRFRRSVMRAARWWRSYAQQSSWVLLSLPFENSVIPPLVTLSFTNSLDVASHLPFLFHIFAQPQFPDETQQILCLPLAEFSLLKFAAFRKWHSARGFLQSDDLDGRTRAGDVDAQRTIKQSERLSLIPDTLLKSMKACLTDIPDWEWFLQWQQWAKQFAFQFTPTLQLRSIIVSWFDEKRICTGWTKCSIYSRTPPHINNKHSNA